MNAPVTDPLEAHWASAVHPDRTTSVLALTDALPVVRDEGPWVGMYPMYR
jgi:hypothetical protein